MLSCTPRPIGGNSMNRGNVSRNSMYHQSNQHIETMVAAASAEVMMYNDARKQWVPPESIKAPGVVASVQILQDRSRNTFRVVAVNQQDILLNCNIHHRFKYHAPSPTFHQWRDEHRQVYGLNFASEADARSFLSVMGQAIDFLNQQHMSGPQEDYQTIHHDNVYQDPHQHLPHNHSAPAFRESDEPSAGLHPNFRQSSQSQSQLSQQQRRASQGSSASSNGHSGMYAQQPAASSSPLRTAPGPPPAPPPPPAGAPPPAPPPPPANFCSNAPPPPPANISSNAPPTGLMAAMSRGGLSLADQLSAKANKLNKTGNGVVKEGRSQSLAENGSSSVAPPPKAAGGVDIMAELAATFNKRKITQAKADAVDNKSNTSNVSSATSTGSSDSGCSIVPPAPANGVKKWETVKTNGNGIANTDSPKTHRKVPSGSSISSQEDHVSKNAVPSTHVTLEVLERFKADLMVEVRLEINKAKQEIIEAMRSELARR